MRKSRTISEIVVIVSCALAILLGLQQWRLWIQSKPSNTSEVQHKQLAQCLLLEATALTADEQHNYNRAPGTLAVEARLSTAPECTQVEFIYMQLFTEFGKICLKIDTDTADSDRVLIFGSFSGQWLADTITGLPEPCMIVPRTDISEADISSTGVSNTGVSNTGVPSKER